MTAANAILGLVVLAGVLAIVGAIVAGRLGLGVVGVVVLAGGIPLALWLRKLRKSLDDTLSSKEER